MEGLYLKIRTLIVICLLMVSLIPGSGCIDSSSEPVKEAKLDEVTDSQDTSSNATVETAHEENFSEESKAIIESEKKSSFFGYYSKKSLQFEADVPPYSLPLKASEIANYEYFSQKIPLTNDSRNLLYKNGFVVIESGAAGGLFEAEPVRVNETYKDLKMAGVPIFITTDSLLHLYHIQFDETLKRVEEKEFYDILWKLDKALLEASIEDYNRSVENKASDEVVEAARRNVAYFAVALSLLEPKPEQIEEKLVIPGKNFDSQDAKQYSVGIPSFVKDDVEAEIRLIEAREGSALSPIFNYDEDYSQYAPRGHYTSSEKLKNYFKAMMWHGRISLLLQPDMITAKELTTEYSVTEKSAAEKSEKQARIQTIQALLISDHFDRDKNLQAEWDRIYDVTAFYVGFSDDLGPYEYAKALDTVFGNDREEPSLDRENLTALKTELERYESPKIYGGTGEIIPVGSETENKTLEATKGFRFMGQRYTPDSYILQKLYPPALNIMDLLGSERARKHLKNLNVSENEEYKMHYLSLENEFGALDEDDWNKNLYWAQLYALKPLLVSYPEGYPTFMQTEAWEDKQLNAALASWTELRHDTILYSKQAYFTSAFYNLEEKPVQGYVEPVPEFYARMLALTKMAHSGLAEMKVLDEQSDKDFTTLESTLEKLMEISVKELENKELTDEEYEFIKNFEQNIAPMLENVEEDAQSSVMVADVYTDGEGRVLEEGTGKLDLIVIAYKQPDGRIVLGAGPVMSYYEFWQPQGKD